MSNPDFRRMVLRICCFGILLACAVWQMLFSYQEQRSFSVKFDKAQAPQARNAQGLTYHAKQKYMLEADLTGAMSLLQQALTVNPSYVPAWLSLAELNNDLGRKDKAYAIMQYVDLLTEGVKRWRWDKTLTAYQLGRMEMLPGELRYIVGEVGGKNRSDALQLAFVLWDEPEALLEQMGLENISSLLGYAVKKDLPQKALFFWNKMEIEGLKWQQKEVLALLDMLLRVGEVKVAADIWRKYFNPDKILFNGDFSQPFLEQAFGWRTGKKQNFDMVFTKDFEGSSSRSIHYHFKGWENINFTHLSQVVPVLGGKKYGLSVEMKAQKMTTDQRPFIEVSGYKCKAPVGRSEMVAADQDWKEHQVLVEVPEECAAVIVRLRRNESRHIDNKLAGQLWLRNFVITETDEDAMGQNTQKQ